MRCACGAAAETGCVQCRHAVCAACCTVAFGVILCPNCAGGCVSRFVYLSGATNLRDAQVCRQHDIGHMASYPSSRFSSLGRFPVWAADNGCFNQGDAFDLDSFLTWLDRHAAFVPTCLFAVAPDVVADAEATLRRSGPAFGKIRALGYPVAFVAQDGLERDELRERIPWQAFDCLFIGGTTEWKLSQHAMSLVQEAKRRGKRVHMGRVNSGRRLTTAIVWGCDSADGTMLTWRTDVYLPRLVRQLGSLRQQPTLWPAISAAATV